MTFQKGHPFYDSPNHYKGGRHKKTHCLRGHLRIKENLYGSNGRFHTCKACHRIKQYEWKRSENLKKFGLNKESWNKMFTDQEGKCVICLRHQSQLKWKLAVDHDHKSGKVRALLCHACNLLIGNANDDASVLQRAIVYLKSFGGDSH